MGLKFTIIFIIVFFALLIFVFPKVLYIATLIYYALFKPKKEDGKKTKHYRIKELREFKEKKIK
jgi:predicted membrane channel-forming protein YqfA (hemolysin III family)